MNTGKVQLCLAPKKSLLVLMPHGGGVMAHESEVLAWPAWSAPDHADAWLAGRGLARRGEWRRDSGFLIAEYGPVVG